MKLLKNKSHGAALMDYIVPGILIACIGGVAIYGFVSNGTLKNAFLTTASGVLDETKGKLYIGSAPNKPGLYKLADGNYYLTTQSGKTIKIPQDYYDGMKESIEQYINDKAGSDTVGEETTGAYGDTNDGSDETDYLTGQYAVMLESMAENVESKNASRLLKTMASYADKMSNIQTDLKDIRDEINSAKANFELAQAKFTTARQEYMNYYQQAASTGNYSQLYDKFYAYRDAYYDYRDNTKTYRDESKKYVTLASDSFNKLKKDTGIGFETLLFLTKTYNKIPQEAKDVAIPVGEEIKELKNKVLVTKENVDYLKTVLDNNKHVVSAEVQQAFESLKILVDDKDHQADTVAVAGNTSETTSGTTDTGGVDVISVGSNSTTGTSTTGATTSTTTGATTGTTTGTTTTDSSAASSTTTNMADSSTQTSTSSQATTEDLENEKNDLVNQINEDLQEDTDVELADNTDLGDSDVTEAETPPDGTTEDGGVDSEAAAEIVGILENLDVSDENSVEDAVESVLNIVEDSDSDSDDGDTTGG
jgi:hypothetical protein